MEQSRVERRRGRRITLQAPLLLRRIGARAAPPLAELLTHNLSLAGVYCETEAQPPLAVNEVVIASVSIPEPHRREFPFTRLAGRGRVVRVNQLPKDESTGAVRYGIALEFGSDLTALTATPSR